MSIIKIALTGGIASGKSQISELLIQYGITVIDMDVTAREVVKPNKPAYQQLIAAFGSDILTAEGELNRKVLRQMMFADNQTKQTIENIIQPRIMDAVERQVSTLSVGLVVIVVPLLIEKGIAHLYHQILVVDCDKRTQINRLMARDKLSRQAATNVLKHQVSREQRIDFVKQYANAYLINNNGDIDQLTEQIKALPFLHL